MNNLSENDYEQLKILIEKMIENKIQEALNNYGVESSFKGTIVSGAAPYDKANVKLSNDMEISLINGSGEKLSKGDNVIVYGSRTNLANRYIGTKLGQSEIIE